MGSQNESGAGVGNVVQGTRHGVTVHVIVQELIPAAVCVAVPEL